MNGKMSTNGKRFQAKYRLKWCPSLCPEFVLKGESFWGLATDFSRVRIRAIKLTLRKRRTYVGRIDFDETKARIQPRPVKRRAISNWHSKTTLEQHVQAVLDDSILAAGTPMFGFSSALTMCAGSGSSQNVTSSGFLAAQNAGFQTGRCSRQIRRRWLEPEDPVLF